MSESREHKRRHNRRLQYIAEFDKWLAEEPNVIRIVKWHKWLKRRPIWTEVNDDETM